MRVGRLKAKVTIKQAAEAADAYGERVMTWSNYAANRWAEVDPQKGVEQFLRQRTISSDTVLFRLRYLTGIIPKMKLIYGGNDYNIRSVINVKNADRELLLECEKII